MLEEMDAVEQGIIKQIGGYSLDFYASEFVQFAESHGGSSK
jgi:hypothetical protein